MKKILGWIILIGFVLLVFGAMVYMSGLLVTIGCILFGCVSMTLLILAIKWITEDEKEDKEND